MNICYLHSVVYVHFEGKAWGIGDEVKGAWDRSRDRYFGVRSGIIGGSDSPRASKSDNEVNKYLY